MIQPITNRQIINVVEQYYIYKTRLTSHQTALRWELLSCGETDRASELQTMIDEDKKTIGQFLDMEV